jgi:uncharacterized protein YneF (UPF0154 family)
MGKQAKGILAYLFWIALGFALGIFVTRRFIC